MEEDRGRTRVKVNIEIPHVLCAYINLRNDPFLGGSSPLCAITILQLIRWVSQNTTKLY
jgi:hypothetical protein